MSHTALARKYRPRQFKELVGQEHVAAGLAGAISKQRVAHGYLLTGPRGTGKTTAARILAMSLNCENPPPDAPGEPCGVCGSCSRIWSGAANLDVVEIDAASNRGVDDARELRERAMYAASGPDRYKVYIVDEAHMLTREAWNALLKILEEPPSRVVFVFATTDPSKIASTTTAVLSRLQRFDFRSIGAKAIEQRLSQVAAAENMEIDRESVRLIGQVANGGMRDALSLLDQTLAFGEGAVTVDRIRDALGLIADEAYVELLDIVAEKRADAVFPFVERLVEMGADLEQFVNGMASVLRALMFHRINGVDEGVSEALKAGLAAHADRFSSGDVMRMISLLADAEENIRRSPNARLHVETLLLHWTLLDRTVELADLMAGLGGGPPADRGGSADRGDEGEARRGRGAAGSRARSGPEAAAAVPPADPIERLDGAVEDLDGILKAWPQVARAVAQQSPLLREAMSRSRPCAMDGAALEIAVDDELLVEGLERKKELVVGVLRDLTGRRMTVRITGAQSRAEDGEKASKRQTAEDDRDARLKSYRAQDPALDAIAEALDLELRE